MSLRIISGSLKGRRIESPKGLLIRPTSDRLRETLFNIIRDQMAGQTVLDLFAGTGALGIEALSRGAQSTVFIDSSSTAVRLIQENLARCGLTGSGRVYRRDLLRTESCLHGIGDSFDLIFMDPPYRLHAVGRTLQNLHRSGILAEQALILAEHDTEEEIRLGEDLPFQMSDRRQYGKTVVSFLKYDIEDRERDSETTTPSRKG